MTTAAYAPSRFDVAERTDLGFPTRLRAALRDWRRYRRVLKELTALDIRQREDLGIAGLDLRAVARGARR